MEDICCTCISSNRKLHQLCRVPNGINNLYLLLSLDIKAFRGGFFKDIAKLYICWECKAMLRRLSSFRSQACQALKLLTDIQNGRVIIESQKSLSKLSVCMETSTITPQINIKSMENFVDCGLTQVEIKEEKDLDNIPLVIKSDICNDNLDINHTDDMIIDDNLDINDKSDINKDNILIEKLEYNVHRNEIVRKRKLINESVYYKNVIEEPIENRDKTRLRVDFSNECIDCMENFGSHEAYEADGCPHKKIIQRARKRTMMMNNLKPQMNGPMENNSFKCPECDKCFINTNLRYKHVLRCHREGYECDICGKRTKFKDSLAKHIKIHETPLPRVECPVCRKMVRSDLMRQHSLIHSERERFSCVECAKEFVSKSSYDHHLKYSKMHTAGKMKKYKCSECSKRYISKGELDDHINYKHLGKTRHKCPVCGKALATKRCVTRHVKRTHENVKEGARDKICQQCGKAFRDKKTLREHEFIHTGERPLSCEICGCTFRQNASLYTHKRRVHHIRAERKCIQLVNEN